ncbi:hypothetical protein Bca52824_032001 [Brassica carinata]|uniref:Uncharacterized protein n=1 Tax=Brassica carinata TaxID=52824 RepID=A0A8X7SB46_BRACI|nr:hypothetical protein Bca52824_032001 [Brassica carinata]
MKRQKEHYIMLQCAADTQYGIPTRCLCGSRIINEVRGKEEYDILPGKRFFTCKNYEEEIERLTKRVKESEEVILLVAKLNEQIETLKEQVQELIVKVDVTGARSTENIRSRVACHKFQVTGWLMFCLLYVYLLSLFHGKV